jgi:hypothetical protein
MKTFDLPTLARFRRAYLTAIHANQSAFTFEGHIYLIAYAKYLLEYLTKELNENP